MEESLQRAREEYGKEGAVVSLGTQQLSDLYLPSPLTTSETTRAPRDHLVDLAHEIQHADATLRASASGKLQTIVDQMRALQEEAKKVLAATARDAKLHQAACNFKKHPGRVYHLYCKAVVDTDDGTATKSPYISMLGPDDWGSSGPGAAHEFQGSFRLEYDQSWTPVSETAARDKKTAYVDHLLGPHVIRADNHPLFAALDFNATAAGLAPSSAAIASLDSLSS